MACPVCKAALEINKVIPIYGRGCDFDPRDACKELEPVPRRPAGQRPIHAQSQVREVPSAGGVHAAADVTALFRIWTMPHSPIVYAALRAGCMGAGMSLKIA